MENTFLGAILLTQFLTFSTVWSAPIPGTCVEGEPLQGDPQPDLNITVNPSLTIPVLNPVAIICDADVPRFPSQSQPNPPLPPVEIKIYVGRYNVKTCSNDNGTVYQCVYDLTSFFPGIPREVGCSATNALGECRFKTANISLIPPPNDNITTTTTTGGSNVTTAGPPINNATTPNPVPPTPTGNGPSTDMPVTTNVIPPIPTTQLPTTPRRDDSDDDDSDDDDSDDDSDDSESDDD